MEKVNHCFSRWPPVGQSGQCWHLIIFQNWGLCHWLRCLWWTLFSNSNLGPDWCCFPQNHKSVARMRTQFLASCRDWIFTNTVQYCTVAKKTVEKKTWARGRRNRDLLTFRKFNKLETHAEPFLSFFSKWKGWRGRRHIRLWYILRADNTFGEK